mgnify:CR=1 FL=1
MGDVYNANYESWETTECSIHAYRYQHKTTRNAIKALRLATDKSDASSKLSNVISMIDKLAKKNIIHDNKASNLKSKLTKHVSKL